MNFEVNVDEPVYVLPTSAEYCDYQEVIEGNSPHLPAEQETQLVSDFETFEADEPPNGVNFQEVSAPPVVAESVTVPSVRRPSKQAEQRQNEEDRERREQLIQKAYQQKLQSPWYEYSDDLPVFSTAGELVFSVALLVAAIIELSAFFLLILASTYFTAIIRDIVVIFLDVIIILALLKVNLALKALYLWCRFLLSRELVGFVILLFSQFYTFTFSAETKLLFAGTILNFISMGVAFLCCVVSVITWLRLFIQNVGV